MRYLKTLGVVAVLAAAFAAYAAGPAFAGETSEKTVLCKTAETSCKPENQYASPTTMAAKLVPGTKAKLRAGFAEIICEESAVGGPASWSEGNHTPHGVLTTEEFQKCNAEITVLEKAELIIHHEVETGFTDTGALTINGGKVKEKIGSTECTYGGTTGIAGSDLMVNGGAPAKVAAPPGTTKLAKVAGGILCASPAEWVAEYEVTAPNPLHISTTP
jgi:hypothetical protein